MKLYLVRSQLVLCTCLLISTMQNKMSLLSMGVERLSPIYRRFYPGTTIADGTRYAKFKPPKNMTSLPYKMKFQKDYYRCIHNGQLKVYSLCYMYASDKLFRACQKFGCLKCKGQGHYARLLDVMIAVNGNTSVRVA